MIKQEVFAVVFDYRLDDYRAYEVVNVYVNESSAIDYLDRMESVMHKEYDWRNHRPTYETIVKEENFVRGTYGKMSCEYRIERATLEINKNLKQED